MLLLIGLVIMLALTYFFSDFIRKKASLIYIITTILTVGMIYMFVTHSFRIFNPFTRKYIFGLFSRGALATAGFIVVMFGAVLPKGTLKKKIMMIRGELSIIASILTLGHNIAFGQSYFVLLLTNPSKLSTVHLTASIISIILILIMIPLFITSFMTVRKKMNPKKWKKLQRWAYLFYFLIYVHVLVLMIPLALREISGALFTIIVYSVIFLSYFALRIRKAILLKNKTSKLAFVPLLVSAIVFALVINVSLPKLDTTEKMESEMTLEDVKDDDVKKAVEEENNKVEEEAKAKAEEETKAKAEEEAKAKAEEEAKAKAEEEAKAKAEEEAKAKAEEEAKAKAEEEAKAKAEEEAKAKAEEEANAKAEEEAKAKAEEEANAKAEESKENTEVDDAKAKAEAKAKAKAEEEAKAKAEAEAKAKAEAEAKAKAEAEAKAKAEAEAAKRVYNDGTYPGVAEGFKSEIGINVTIKDDKIVSLKVLFHDEDEPYFSDAKKGVFKNVLSAQSTDVATVSGATISSKAILKAIKSALLSAKK